MKMIIGGAFQGQIEWARQQYKEAEKWIDGSQCSLEALCSCDGVYDFHKFIQTAMKAGERVEELAQHLIENNPEMIIVTNEIGYGLVPVNPFERIYREQTGRVCTELAAFSEEVVRVVMGIPVWLKGAKK